MRSALIIFEDKEFDKLNDIRKKMTWRRFVLKFAGLPYEVKHEKNPKRSDYTKRQERFKKTAAVDNKGCTEIQPPKI
jgi:hypothetical protein